MKKPKLQQRTIKVLDNEVIQRCLLNGRDIATLRNKAMLYMFLDTGLRLSKLANLKVSDIDLHSAIIKTNGKGNKERFVRIGVKTQKALCNYITHGPVDTEHVWHGKDNNKMAVDIIAQMIRNLGKRLGIQLSPHK